MNNVDKSPFRELAPPNTKLGTLAVHHRCEDLVKNDRKIRFIGMFSGAIYKFIFYYRNESIAPLLTEKDKIDLLHISLSSQKFRASLESKIGYGLYVLEEYEKVKRVTIPIKEDLVLITLEKDFEEIEKTVNEIYDIFYGGNNIFNSIFSVSSNAQNKAVQNNTATGIKTFEDLFKTICLNEYNNLRYVSIADENGKIKHEYFFPGVITRLSQTERNLSIIHALKRWEKRNKFQHKIGKGLYALATYEKMKRITFPLKNGHLLLLTAEVDSDHKYIIEWIVELSKNLR